MSNSDIDGYLCICRNSYIYMSHLYIYVAIVFLFVLDDEKN